MDTNMKTRVILYILTLLAYTLSLAHSVIPHHHHKSTEEARSHEHTKSHRHDHGKNHHHHDSEEKPEHESDKTGHFFFFSHDINTDVLIKHTSVGKSVKTNKVQVALPEEKQIAPFEFFAHLVFHPPQSDKIFVFEIHSSRSLRAPPFFKV